MSPLEIAAIASTIVSTGLGVVGVIQQSEAREAAAEFNQKVADQRAAREEEAGNLARENKLAEASRQRASTIAGFAASGVETGAGTPLQVTTETFRRGVFAANTARHNRLLGAERLEQEGALQGQAAEGFRNARLPAAGASLLGGASKAFGQISTAIA